ncbi:ribosome recycling factor [Corynebacterium sp. CCM 8835]|uniref:Ribosome-recycling factor n=1 Tax=Corynebacterium antarcticum TaxID=2800405 RepID=A0A9Q4CAN2_9CORY|nr:MULTISPECIES: ribosome recycling factor [Corynebacterium]MBV7294032.1 ribosome recycling factor [Corynebacterium sp. TAE3-ERU16]MCK7641681.1 ribosome recycling factor [Corynebacterium antarcticum]MCK7660221.1 ribosome recycling factor [Corynebacterium antarcticum]MCL0244909.1 ribosome recycling factor [Corynebacterium antarcticum]MCX7491282.1 ribosome recycling factor [Corynebacterium antarcticum]
MIDDTLLEAEERMTSSVEHARDDLTTIRTGRANPGMFNGIVAEYYGVPTPITQMATISVPEPRMLIIRPYEQNVMNEIENAIRNSDLGVNPTNDGQVLRVTVPQLTEERRRDMVKLAKSKGEDAKIAIRNVRRKHMEILKKIQKDGEAGEDEVIAAEKELDKTTQKYVGQIDELVEKKEKELMEV